MGVQSLYDIYVNSGGGQYSLRKQVQNNPETYPYSLGPADYNAVGWTLDPLDTNSNTIAAWGATGTQVLVEMSLPNTVAALTGVSLLLGTTAAGTPVSYCGFAVYSIGATTATLIGSTADNHGSSWAASSWQSTALSAQLKNLAQGKYYLSAIVHATTMPTTTGANIPSSVAHSTGFNGATIPSRCATNGVQASFPATVTLSTIASSQLAAIPIMVAY